MIVRSFLIILVFVWSYLLHHFIELPFGELSGSRLTLIFGSFILFSYLFSYFFLKLKLPRLTGYILAGIIYGPFLFNFVTPNIIKELKFVDNLALSFIAISAGLEIDIKVLKEKWKTLLAQISTLTLFKLIGIILFIFIFKDYIPINAKQDLVILFAIAVSLSFLSLPSSPSVAIGIITETKAKGIFTELTLATTIGLDIVVIILFAIIMSLLKSMLNPLHNINLIFLISIMIELISSITLGILIGFIIKIVLENIEFDPAIFILIFTFFITELSQYFSNFLEQWQNITFHLEPLLICMVSGIFLRNYTKIGSKLIHKLEIIALTVYVVFFSLAGAYLDFNVFKKVWHFAIIFAILRLLLTFISTYISSIITKEPKFMRPYFWMTYISQAGISIGLAIEISKRFPSFGEDVKTIILAVIIINQIIGPILHKLALVKVKETYF